MQSLLLDGERPFGYRASNRTIKLPIIIKAPDFVTMTAAREVLMQLIDQQTWTLTWTPGATGLPLVFDCFRAQPTIVTYGFLQNRMPYAVINLTFRHCLTAEATRTGSSKSHSPAHCKAASPHPLPVTLDSFSSVSGTGWSSSASKFVVGPHSAHYSPGTWPQLAATYTKTGLSANITGLPTLSVWFGQVTTQRTTGRGRAWHPISRSTGNSPIMSAAPVTHSVFTPPITNAGGRTLRPTRPGPGSALTSRKPPATFNYNNVASYSVTISNWVSNGVLFSPASTPG